MEKLLKLYKEYTGNAPIEVSEIASSGSNRRYFRLHGEPTLIGVIGPNQDENNAFVYLAKHFEQAGLNVPSVLKVSDDSMVYLQTDLGDDNLFKAIEKGRLTKSFSSEEKELLVKTIRMLPDIQFKGAVGLDFKYCYPSEQFDLRSIMWDLNYFKYCFLKAVGLEFDENRLEDDFQALAEVLLRSQSSTFMYRDFQSRNIMLKDGEPYFIDFQGGRKGPLYYDVASFLWQAKAGFPQSLRNELITEYIAALRKYKPVDQAYFNDQLRHFVLFRTLQVLGAYGFRGYFEKKPHFLQSVPYAIDNLRHLLDEEFPEYPYLSDVLRRLTNMSDFNDRVKHQLTVRVLSFAYKKGIPNDTTGNGGGYVFDCRAINNPGKYDRYKPYTGLDRQVIEFLEDDGEITRFLEHCYSLVDATIERYIERGFTSLMIAYGCTGGQHRSVYSAQHTAEHIASKFNCKVILNHREQNIEQIFDSKQ